MEESKTMEQEPVTQEEEIVGRGYRRAEDASETADQEEAQAEPETAEEDAGD